MKWRRSGDATIPRDGFTYLAHGISTPTRDPLALIDVHRTLYPRTMPLYVADVSSPGQVVMNPLVVATRLKDAGFDVFVEARVENHRPPALLSLLASALMTGIDAVVLLIDDSLDIDELQRVLDDWHDLLPEIPPHGKSKNHDPDHKGVGPVIFASLDHGFLDAKEEMFERLHLAGIDGVFLPENYDPVKLINTFNTCAEYRLVTMNRATIYHDTRQAKLALSLLPRLDLPPAFLGKLNAAREKMTEGISYFQEFITFIQNFDSKGVLIENPTARVMAALSPVIGAARTGQDGTDHA